MTNKPRYGPSTNCMSPRTCSWGEFRFLIQKAGALNDRLRTVRDTLAQLPAEPANDPAIGD